LRPIAFVLTSTNHGSMLVNRFDYHLIQGRGGYGVGYQILNTSAFDPGEIALAVQLLISRKKNFGDGVVAVDCGANIGVHTIEWAQAMYGWGEVLAFEAQERIYYALAGNIALNNCFNAKAILAAIGSKPGEILVPQPDYFSPSSSGSLEIRKTDSMEFIGQKIDYSEERCVKIEMKTIDQLGLKRLDFVKLDIEGMEIEALIGAEQSIRQFKPQLMIERIKSSEAEIRKFLEKFSYEIFEFGLNFLAIDTDDPEIKTIQRSRNPVVAQPPSQVAALFAQGLALHQQGQLTEAKLIYEQVLAKQAQHFDALHLSGVIAAQNRNPTLAVNLIGRAIEVNPKHASAHYNRGVALNELKRAEEALASYDKAIAIKPDYADAHSYRGNTLNELNRVEEAVASYDRAIAIKPDHAAVHYNRGAALKKLKRVEEAVASYDKAIDIKPDYAEAYYNRGNALYELKRAEEALASYDRAIAAKPDHADAHSNRGNALKELKRVMEALASYDFAIAIKPDHAEAHFNRGVALNELKRAEEAISSYDRAIAIKPDYAEAHSNRGVALQGLKRVKEALASYDRAIAIEPDYADAHSNRGVALQELQRAEESVASYDRAIAIKPDHSDAHYNRGNALQDLKRVEEAVTSYDRAIAIEPDYAEAGWNKSFALLLAGDFARGWEFYEWRWKNEKTGLKSRNFLHPLWLGEEDITGKSILLHAEQGLGDTIQFCRYAKLVKALGPRVVLEVPDALCGVLSGLEGVDELIEQGKALPAFDYHCPLLSLPLAFKTDLTDIPSPKPYLAASPQKFDEWAQRLGAKGKPRVGLAWSGSTGHKNDHNRSLTLQQLLPHLPEGYEYVSLQKEVRQVDRAVLEVSRIRHYGNDLRDFTDTAALCELMDLVISVDTSVAHLAGAIGKTTWVLLPYSADWRWLLNRDDSPWYESMRLYRQDETREWPLVLARMAKDIDS